MYCVYKHTCPDNQVYVGITCKDPKDRWQNGNGYRGQWFYNGIEKHGWDNIKHEIVQSELSKEEAMLLEEKLIDELHSWCPGVGYNDALGGRKGYSKMIPVRDPQTHKVYASVSRACKDVGHDTYWVLRRFEKCTEKNVSPLDVYMPL